MAISMLMDLLSKAATVAMLSFVVSSMLAMGAGLTVARIIEPLRNVRLVLFALVAKPTGEFPRLCRGGSKSLTYPGVGAPRSIDETPDREPPSTRKGVPPMDGGESLRWTK